jgi:hypothetical protein
MAKNTCEIRVSWHVVFDDAQRPIREQFEKDLRELVEKYETAYVDYRGVDEKA